MDSDTLDTRALVPRAKQILLAPKAAWPQIAGEPASVKSLYVGYIMILAAIGPVFNFIENSLIGRTLSVGEASVHFRIGIGSGIGGMIVQWILALVGVYVVAFIVNALAGTFGAQSNQIQALKAVAYAETAVWVAACAVIIPWIGWLIMLAGAIYTIYLLYLGLPATMQCPPEKAAGYTALTIICAIIVYLIIGLIVGAITGVNLAGHVQPGADVHVQVPDYIRQLQNR